VGRFFKQEPLKQQYHTNNSEQEKYPLHKKY